MQTVLRNPNLDVISMDQLRRYSPAVFAKEAHESVSDRYGFIPTFKVLEHMHKAGFVPVEVRNYQRRDPLRMRFTKHMIRFRQSGQLAARTVGDVVPQVVMLNSHDRSSPYQLYGGLFRLICSNGLLVADSAMVAPIKLRHTLQLAENVVEASAGIIKSMKNVFQHVDVMRKIQLTEKEQKRFAADALALRPESGAGIIESSALLTPRRAEDNGADLWHVFNRVQENLLKGGLSGKTGEGRMVRTAEIKAINRDIEYNAGIWGLAMGVIAKASKSSAKVVKSKVKATA